MHIYSSITRFLLLCIAACLCFLSTSVFANSFLWKVYKDHGEIYLYGSIHMGRDDMYPLPDNVLQAFESAHYLVVEVNESDMDQMSMQNMLLAKGMYNSNETLQDHIDSPTMSMLNKFLSENSIPYATVAKLRPGVLSLTLTIAQLMKMGLSPELGIDNHFLDKARTKNLPILQLETAEQQLNLLLSFKDESNFLRYTLISIGEMPREIDIMVQAWKEGDTRKMKTLMLDEPLKQYPEFTPLFNALFTQRNIAMAEKIKQYLQTEHTYFVIVGAGHLVGDEGIVSLLKKSGARISQM